MTQPYLGQITMFGGNFAPRNYAFCSGQLMSIQQNTALFSLLGTFYGGNGVTTFALPDLRGKAPVNYGNGPGLTPYVIGQTGGTATQALTNAQNPSHRHLAQAVAGFGQAPAPTGNLWAQPRVGRGAVKIYSDVVTNPDNLDPNALGLSGVSQPHNNVPPVLAISFIIALQGIFPSRN